MKLKNFPPLLFIVLLASFSTGCSLVDELLDEESSKSSDEESAGQEGISSMAVALFTGLDGALPQDMESAAPHTSYTAMEDSTPLDGITVTGDYYYDSGKKSVLFPASRIVFQECWERTNNCIINGTLHISEGVMTFADDGSGGGAVRFTLNGKFWSKSGDETTEINIGGLSFDIIINNTIRQMSIRGSFAVDNESYTVSETIPL